MTREELDKSYNYVLELINKSIQQLIEIKIKVTEDYQRDLLIIAKEEEEVRKEAEYFGEKNEAIFN